MKTNPNEPANPCTLLRRTDKEFPNDKTEDQYPGLTKREDIAKHLMAGLMARKLTCRDEAYTDRRMRDWTPAERASVTVKNTDALIAELNKDSS